MSPLKRFLGLPFGWLLLSILVLCAVGLPTSFEGHDDPDPTINEDYVEISFNTMPPTLKEASTSKPEDQFIDLTQSNQCGKSASGIVPKDGTLNSTYQSEYGAFPWMTAIFHNGQFIAAGSLIRLDIVLTSKDSVREIPQNELQVYAGAWDLRRSGEKYSKLNRSVIDIAARDNIAILFLSTPFFNPPSIQAICLPQTDAVFTEIDCKTIGWSQPSDTSTYTSQSDILWFRKNVVLPREDCESEYNLLGNRTLEPDVFCAIDVSNELSPLNSGSGLFCVNGSSKHSVLAGVSLSSRDWSLDNRPALFANIPHYLEWIQRELSEDETNENQPS
ncbi:phenoloxidase-activating factor 2-like isoform X1 [Drosophila pseudoobscura]|uniref:Phenoloxidase-activating factor 2-like isoform X1 n=1 Tax=Drosophila pseudoobscura pseudoobscura TaxID=46245 RepID=A0A6I8V9S8_DROPS|nr:phenoloxidase-activating factor 2 isoform X1 [Drosophila pseudoobscura]